MKNEHLKLVRDLFHVLSIGAFGVAFFTSDTGLGARAIGVITGGYFHLIAHIAVA